MNIPIPELALVVLIGPSSAGKSTFARAHFLPTEILSSDYCRALVADDENAQSATADAFDVLHFIAAKRLRAGRLTVIDATNVQAEARRPLLELARRYHCPAIAIVLNVGEEVCLDRHRSRTDRPFRESVVQLHHAQFKQSLPRLRSEGFKQIHTLGPQDIAQSVVERQPHPSNRRADAGPFDIIGDVHGCFDELCALLCRLGYAVSCAAGTPLSLHHPQGRKAVFVGDLVDRGPKIPQVLRLVMEATRTGAAYCVKGNHDDKLYRALQGRQVSVDHGLGASIEQLALQSDQFKAEVIVWLQSLPDHIVLDEGRLVVAHAGLPERMHGRSSGRVRAFALYGDTSGGTDEFGMPLRRDWAADYRGEAAVVYGHTPVSETRWVNKTLCVDTGCVFGGKLTALRYPECELLSVQALAQYVVPSRPLSVG